MPQMFPMPILLLMVSVSALVILSMICMFWSGATFTGLQFSHSLESGDAEHFLSFSQAW